MIIHSIEEFAAEIFGTTPDDLDRSVYKYTDCGAWINWDEKGICIGSIVEGSDVEFTCDTLVFPFDSKEYDEQIEWLESETSREWHRVNPDWDDLRVFVEELFRCIGTPLQPLTVESAETLLDDLKGRNESWEDWNVDIYCIDPEDFMTIANEQIKAAAVCTR